VSRKLSDGVTFGSQKGLRINREKYNDKNFTIWGDGMLVKVCMGSSCHLKGSYTIVEELQKLKQKGFDLDIFGSLCFGRCAEGVCVEIDGQLHTNVTPEKLEQLLGVKACR
jgi:NADH:ubiquinone oxidoreductase subunit E